jgi:hypothetical protein
MTTWVNLQGVEGTSAAPDAVLLASIRYTHAGSQCRTNTVVLLRGYSNLWFPAYEPPQTCPIVQRTQGRPTSGDHIRHMQSVLRQFEDRCQDRAGSTTSPYQLWRKIGIFQQGGMDRPEYGLAIFRRHFEAARLAAL